MHALVTGAGGAIGGAVARALRRRDSETRLTLSDVHEGAAAGVVDSVRPHAEIVACDLADEAGVPDLVDRATRSHGPIDLLVNCAGIMEVRSLVSTPWDVGARLLGLDLMSPLRLMHAVAPAMAERGHGCIVNVTSMAGVTPLRGCTFYGAAKAGLAMASEIARLELAPRGVQVITVYPGPVRSALERRARAQYPTSPITEMLPTGDADAIASRILRARDRGAARVVYPSLYAVAQRAPGIAGRVTSWLGPAPRS